MKSTKRLLYLQWFAVTAFITIVCVGAGNYLFHYLSSREEMQHKEIRIGPLRQRLEIIDSLVRSGKMSAREAFEAVDKAREAPIPEKSLLLDKEGNVIAHHQSEYWREGREVEFEEHVLSSGEKLRIYLDLDHRLMGPRGFGPGPGPRGPHGPPGPRFPPGFFLIAVIVTGVSIIIGIGFSLLLLTYYLRKRAKQVEKVMGLIQSGDLSARFDIGQADEVGELMGRFNLMAQEIEKLVTNLRETEESRKRMLQELAHDLRTPVASLKNLQEILFSKGDILDEEKKTHLQNLAQREVSYFERLVEDLLFLSGVNDPRYSSSLKDVDLSTLLEEEAELFKVGKVLVRIDAEAGVFVRGEVMLLRRLIRNALSNALRYARKEVVVTLRKNGGIHLLVQDDGPGFSEVDLSLFGEKKFSRNITDEKGHISVGLGSVIMKKIMDLHDGTLTVRNRGPGAELDFTFPV